MSSATCHHGCNSRFPPIRHGKVPQLGLDRVPEATIRSKSDSSARTFLLTILGQFVVPRGGGIWTSTILTGLHVFGVSESNARQALSRLGDQGHVYSAKNGRNAQWHVTDQGRRYHARGSERLLQFRSTEDEWNGRWLVVICPVPAEQRSTRRLLRNKLGYAGCGFLAPGLALTPHLDREATVSAILKELGLLPGAVILRAETGELIEDPALLQRAWNLDSLAERYDQFISQFLDSKPRSDKDCFQAVVELIHSWGRFPFLDPEIPKRLLPRSWSGDRAKSLFDKQYAKWSPRAHFWFDNIEANVIKRDPLLSQNSLDESSPGG
jgi:phenylacetic acid degradation operon negative regulatory protein